jgi:hypothetical protein
VARYLSESEEKIRKQLYDSGYHDYEIARRLGVTPSAICSWRKSRGLSPNGKVGGSHLSDRMDERSELYELGLSDADIARRQGVTRQAIWLWRQKKNLPKNSYPCGGTRPGHGHGSVLGCRNEHEHYERNEQRIYII